MKFRVRVAETDADLERVSAVRAAVARAWDSPPSLEATRHHLRISSERRYLLAIADGTPVGCASVGSLIPGDRSSEMPVQADVLAAARRRGIGSALLRRASAHARSLARSALVTEVYEDDEDSLAFVARRGFVEVERQKGLMLDLATAPARPKADPPGVEIVSRSERAGLERGMFESGRRAARDIPGRDAAREPTFEEWRSFEIARPTRDPRLCFVALVDARVVGFASVDVIGDNGYHGLTAVVREHRRRGIARALKQHQIATARMLGIRRFVTESEERNEPMRRLNASLGYRPIPGMVVLTGPLQG